MFDKKSVIAEEIGRHLYRLSQVRLGYEARWGIGQLEALCSPALAKKWDVQQEKLARAVKSNNLEHVQKLVGGCIRAYEALERDVLEKGGKYRQVDCWSVRAPESKREYLVVKSDVDAVAVQDGESNVWTLEEIVRVLETRMSPILEIKDAIPGATLEKFDFIEGDDVGI